VRSLKVFTFSEELGVTKDVFDASLAKHRTDSEQKALEFTT
jgi:hypothetical protein